MSDMKEGGKRIAHGIQKEYKVSIITVIRNAESFIDRFITNTSNYCNEDVELVILDGNSTDSSLELLHSYNDKIDYWRSEPDKGIYDAMNNAIKYAKGKWLYFLGVDDYILPGFPKAIDLLADANTVYYGKVIIWGEIVGRPLKRYDLIKVILCHQSIFYPKFLFDSYQYKTEYVVSADHLLNIMSFTDKRFKWKFIDQLIAIFDTRGHSAQNVDHKFEKDQYRYIRRYLGFGTYARYAFRKFKQTYRKTK
jgi:glycosyltransferase involved in cell wall biosynthesis